ncbi:MAG: N-succinylarginine dihydrolase [Myxococcota bacterium]
MSAREFNFDGLVGPTHHYGGISFGNVASAQHAGAESNPRKAALQGLDKMRALYDLGVPQAVLPPHYRPELSLARRMGFQGDDASVLRAVAEQMPLLLAACYSASSMWTANAATVSPSADSADGRVHFTPANLQNKIHRSIEAPGTASILRAIFASADHFAHHAPLPSTVALGDEGAANHTRFCSAYGRPGVQFFVFGETAAEPWARKPKLFPARHTREASEGVRRLHQVDPAYAVFAQQNPEVIDEGVFHNDVISVGDRETFFFHEQAFVDTERIVAELRETYRRRTERDLRLIQVPRDRVRVSTAVATYLFNSQLVAGPEGERFLIAPIESAEREEVKGYLDERVAEGDLAAVHFVDLRQSMQGGGGPACLRLRVVLTEAEARAMAPGVVYQPELDEALRGWVNKHYRESLFPRDLADPALLGETQTALDELTTKLGLGSIYPFQRAQSTA